MPGYTPRLLSGSTNGRPIKVAATATPGTLLHTAVAGTSDADYLWLDVYNSDAAAVDLTIEWGGTTDPDDLHPKTLSVPPLTGPFSVAANRPLQNGLVVRAFASSANKLTITGRVTRYTAGG